MNVNAEIVLEKKENALLLPIEAVQKRGNKYLVTLNNAQSDNKKSSNSIEVGLISDSNMEILSGLKEGDIVKYSVNLGTGSSQQIRTGGFGMPGAGRQNGGGGGNHAPGN